MDAERADTHRKGCLIAAIIGGFLFLNWLVGVGAIAGFIALFVGVFQAILGSEPYVTAVDLLNDDPRVVARLGEPIEPGWWATGTVNHSGSTGTADICLPVSGPRGGADACGQADKTDGAWHFTRLVVDIDDTGERITIERGRRR